MVYPVWFGTNRKPDAGDGFTGERHDRVTLGRVEVFVPEAHRFGETGNAFWKRLLRFDLRDDRLRLQRVQNQDRDAFYSEIHQAMQAARESGETAACAGLPARIQRHLRGRGDPRGADRLRPEGAGRDGVLQLAVARQRGGLPGRRGEHRGQRAADHRFPGGFRRELRGRAGARHRAQHGQPRPASRPPADRGHCSVARAR